MFGITCYVSVGICWKREGDLALSARSVAYKSKIIGMASAFCLVRATLFPCEVVVSIMWPDRAACMPERAYFMTDPYLWWLVPVLIHEGVHPCRRPETWWHSHLAEVPPSNTTDVFLKITFPACNIGRSYMTTGHGVSLDDSLLFLNPFCFRAPGLWFIALF